MSPQRSLSSLKGKYDIEAEKEAKYWFRMLSNITKKVSIIFFFTNWDNNPNIADSSS
jgi:hypothetical protein